MQNEEITLDTQEVQQESEVVVEQPKADDGVKLSPAEYRHFKKWETDGKPTVKATVTQTPITKDEYTLNDEVVDLRLDGYSKDDVQFIMKNGGRKTLEDKNSYVSIAINARKEQARAEAEANKVVDTSGHSEIERKYTTDQLKNMSKEELAKILPRIS
jgi:hypothetical protein